MNYLKLAVSAVVLLGATEAWAKCVANPSCSTYGYNNASSNCKLGYVACPWNISFVRCDEEADKGDFKYTLTPSVANGWTRASTYEGNFIVGAVLDGEPKSYCATYVGKKRNESIKKHGHSVKDSDGNDYLAETSTFKGTRYRSSSGSNWSVYTTTSTTTPNYRFTKTYVTRSHGATSSNNNFPQRPVNYSVRGYNYSGMSQSTPSGSLKCTNDALKCLDMGYIDVIANCPGTKVKCPLDDRFVKCDLEAQAGEIKFSWQTADHKGWLKCDGRSLVGSQYAKSDLAVLLSSNNFGTNLPLYQGTFLKVSSEVTTYQENDRVMYHEHGVYTDNWDVLSLSKTDTCKSGAHSSHRWQQITSTEPVGSSTAQSTTNTGNSYETAPPHYAANVFIYTGRLNVQDASTLTQKTN